MFEEIKKYVVVFVMAFAVLGYSACILSPTEVPPDKPASNWKDLTEKEDVITNLMQCYTSHDITHYKELLHEDYIWYNQVAEAEAGEVELYFQRDDDIQKTKNMFDAADRTYEDETKWLDKLELTIASGSWTQLTEFNGEACDDCWQTLRQYYITLDMAVGELTLYGDDNVQFTIVGVDKGGKRIYQLGRADDILR
jgi:hypothetical protein